LNVYNVSQEDFDAAAEKMGNTHGPSNDEMLELYALFKQAKVGDNDTCECRAGVELLCHNAQHPSLQLTPAYTDDRCILRS
jgi:acyl-CoA-binding protein